MLQRKFEGAKRLKFAHHQEVVVEVSVDQYASGTIESIPDLLGSGPRQTHAGDSRVMIGQVHKPSDAVLDHA